MILLRHKFRNSIWYQSRLGFDTLCSVPFFFWGVHCIRIHCEPLLAVAATPFLWCYPWIWTASFWRPPCHLRLCHCVHGSHLPEKNVFLLFKKKIKKKKCEMPLTWPRSNRNKGLLNPKENLWQRSFQILWVTFSLFFSVTFCFKNHFFIL